jgi:peroxisomal 3,2-trans-enoyl-CoA isomerase
MGSLKASEVLLFGKKISAMEAEALGLVTKVFPDAELDSLVWPKLKEISELPPSVRLY